VLPLAAAVEGSQVVGSVAVVSELKASQAASILVDNQAQATMRTRIRTTTTTTTGTTLRMSPGIMTTCGIPATCVAFLLMRI
jgi:hypothetical protein